MRAAICAAFFILGSVEAMEIKRVTPLILVDGVEEALPFWIDGLGFEKTAEVPGEDGRLVFVSMEANGIELMLQTRASVAADIPALADDSFHVPLFVEVDDLEAVRQRLPESAEVLIDERKTFYGSTEMIVRTRDGHVVTLAVFAAEE